MGLELIKTALKEIENLRSLFLHENNFQYIHNKCHDYGWADTFLFTIDSIKIGYGSVWGKDERTERDTIFEFYLAEPWRNISSRIFSEFVLVSGVKWIEAQSNDLLLSSMLYEYAKNINAEAILFEDEKQTNFQPIDVIFRKNFNENQNPADSGEYVLEQGGKIVASGGFMLNYNFPYADIYMNVKEEFRQKGFGSLIIQELKKEIYEAGRIPAARCNITNHVSKATLIKSGFKVCGALLTGEVKE